MSRLVLRTTDCTECERKEGQRRKTGCSECRRDAQRSWRADHPDYHSSRQRDYNKIAREGVLEAYGGKCSCCGESTPEFLSVEHSNNDGAAHRKRLGGSGGMAIYHDLRRRGFPQDEGILLHCFNCNLAKGFFGYCPHERER